jgi:ElaB/YqjD/DUF883 family membrane-anchored ribosome-binding protein
MTADTDRIEAEINRSRHALNDTIEQLGGKLSPGQMLDEVMGLAQGQAGKLTANLGKQIQENPLPLLLVGAGVAMLFLNKQHGHGHNHQAVHPGMSHDEWKEEQRYRTLEGARSGVARLAGETQEMFSHRLHQAEAVALDLKQHAGEAVDAFKARVTRTSEGLAAKAKDIREKMNAGAAATAQFAKDQAHNLKEGLGDAKHRTQAFYDEYPLAAGAIGVAIGALIGASAPLSSIEREKLQGVADAAAKAGADLAEKGAKAVDKAANALH